MDTIEAKPREAKLLGELPLRLHHNAYVVKDHEANRRFLEDLLGIPLVATWCEKTYAPISAARSSSATRSSGSRTAARSPSSSSPTRRCTS